MFDGTQQYISSQGVVLDFDRTLGNPEAAMQRLYVAAADFGIDVRELQSRRIQAEQSGKSFEPLLFIEKALGDPKTFQELCDHFLAPDEPSILYPDALPLLKQLESKNIPTVVLTYGVSMLWQQLKIAASGYAGAVQTMDNSLKGRLIATWRTPDGFYQLPVSVSGLVFGLVRSICLIDDKAVACEGLPEDCIGFLVRRVAPVPSQQGIIPPGVKIIHSLTELSIDGTTSSLLLAAER